MNKKSQSIALKVKLAQQYVEDFKRIKTKEDALIWSKSLPENLKTIILCLLSIAKSENALDFD